MRRINKRYSKKYGGIIVSHLQNNLREYTIGGIIFLIGILLGVFFLNNLDDVQTFEINTYLSDSILNIKNSENINNLDLLKESITNDFTLVVLLWLMGSTVIGLLLVYLIVCFKGFCFGYTLSAIIYVFGTGKGILFFILTMFLKNIVAIPCTISLAVSGMNLYKSIMQDRRKENIKMEVIRHTFFSIFILILLVLSSFIEVYLSQNLLKYSINLF